MDETYRSISNYRRFKKPFRWMIFLGVVCTLALCAFVVNLIHPVVKFGKIASAAVPSFSFNASVDGRFDTKKEAISAAFEKNQTVFLYEHEGKWLNITKVHFEDECDADDDCVAFEREKVDFKLATEQEVKEFNEISAALFKNIDELLKFVGDDDVCCHTVSNEASLQYNALKSLCENRTGATKVFADLDFAANLHMFYLNELVFKKGATDFPAHLDKTIAALSFVIYDLLGAICQ